MQIKTYLPSLRFFIMVAIVWVLITLIARNLPADNAWAQKVKYYLGYASA